MEPSFFQHLYDLTGPKYAEQYEDSESDIKSIHFLAKMPQQHDNFFITFFNRGRAGVILLSFGTTVLCLVTLLCLLTTAPLHYCAF